ncbi:hypothetical protein QA648_00480 [Rhizobium sp. CB3171]|uniref:hypothetical protein n=1 Tax=Rhizobium sp. CB3171 TaxID=3039157 RepID=UPI0024B231AE|nr:hypothetical protein [Rhizobium sp. CB3171]WFU02295.1 hypothetical protein QA648_00480 [Rhizobium sp. CB3171]
MEDTTTITNRSDFAQWAIERARAIMGEEGADLALAAQGGNEETIRAAGNALGSAISEALLEVFDALLDGAD